MAVQWTERANGIIEVKTEVSVLPGAIVDLKIGGGDAVGQREWGLTIVEKLARDGKLPGFDPAVHQLVAPRTPFKTGTKDHAEDEGLHVTVVQGYGFANEEIPESALLLAGRKAKVGIDLKTIRFLQGRPHNDEACGMLFYVGAEADAATKALVDELRAEMGLEKKIGYFPHISLAGIAPVGSRELEDIQKLRAEWAPPFPDEGFPDPLTVLERQSASLSLGNNGAPEHPGAPEHLAVVSAINDLLTVASRMDPQEVSAINALLTAPRGKISSVKEEHGDKISNPTQDGNPTLDCSDYVGMDCPIHKGSPSRPGPYTGR
jgi:hypothetical protein